MSSVHLVVYDLSHGMARQLSAQFLGGPQYAIDIIPHTALVVFGREYFFGGGIQHEDPQQFRRLSGMHPIQTLVLGTTSVSRTEFEQWCERATRNGRYAASSYDLLERNCNNFSHDAAREGLRLTQGVPEWILEVPRKFLSSPMGQIVRPMLQNMQVTGGTGGTTVSNPTAPFAKTPTRSFDAKNVSVSVPPVSSLDNPWATSAAVKESPSSTPLKTPTLDSYTKPLLSKDCKTLLLCAKKIAAGLVGESDKQIILETGANLSTEKKLTVAQLETTCSILCENIFLLNGDKSGTKNSGTITFALMFLRVLVLQAGDYSESSSVSSCVEWICKQLEKSADQSCFVSTASRTMAYLVLANVASVPDLYKIPTTMIESTLLKDWAVSSQPRKEVRQAAAALAYNYVISIGHVSTEEDEDVSDDIISLLCASMEGLEMETDATTLLRRALVAARILRPVNSRNNRQVILSLIRELGFVDILQRVQSISYSKSSDGTQCQLLVKELILMLD